MATRARIGIELTTGKVVSSYCHYDGYPAGLGFNLVENYSDRSKLQQAIELGDASTWAEEIGEKVSFEDREAREFQNIYYGRDRGEANTEAVTFDNIDEFMSEYDMAGEEYAYVLTLDGLWVMNARYRKMTHWDAEFEIRQTRERLEEKMKKALAN